MNKTNSMNALYIRFILPTLILALLAGAIIFGVISQAAHSPSLPHSSNSGVTAPVHSGVEPAGLWGH